MVMVTSAEYTGFKHLPYTVKGEIEQCREGWDVRTINVLMRKEVTNSSDKDIQVVMKSVDSEIINSDYQTTIYTKTSSTYDNSYKENGNLFLGTVKPSESVIVTIRTVALLRKFKKNIVPQNIPIAAYASGNLSTDVYKYLYSSMFIESNANAIISEALNLKRKSTSANELIENTVNYTKSSLKLDVNSLYRNKGALSALKNKEGVCQEFADLTVALLRASGIPARVCTGLIFTNLDDAVEWSNAYSWFHDWVEVYIPEYGWMAIDPTNLSTVYTLDQYPSVYLMTLYYDDRYFDYMLSPEKADWSYSQTLQYVDGYRELD